MLRSLGLAVLICVLTGSCVTGAGKRGDAVPQKPYGRLDMVILAVEDVKKAASFYDAAFRWPRRIDLAMLVEFELPDGRGLAVYQRENFANNTGTRPSLASSRKRVLRGVRVTCTAKRRQRASGLCH